VGSEDAVGWWFLLSSQLHHLAFQDALSFMSRPVDQRLVNGRSLRP
jgi:hypothetical protein